MLVKITWQMPTADFMNVVRKNMLEGFRVKNVVDVKVKKTWHK